MSTGHETELLGAYVLGVLDETGKTTVTGHLDGCDDCRREVGELREIEAALGEVPPEALIDGPPADADLLLQRTLREVRGERGRRDREVRVGYIAAAVVAGLVLFGGGAAIGLTSRSSTTSTALPAPSATAAPSISASGRDAATGAEMAVTIKPAAGWVRVNAAVRGVAAGQQCRLFVVNKDGSRREAGSWLVSPAGAQSGTTLDGAALVPPAEVAAVQVETFAGRLLVSVPV